MCLPEIQHFGGKLLSSHFALRLGCIGYYCSSSFPQRYKTCFEMTRVEGNTNFCGSERALSNAILHGDSILYKWIVAYCIFFFLLPHFSIRRDANLLDLWLLQSVSVVRMRHKVKAGIILRKNKKQGTESAELLRKRAGVFRNLLDLDSSNTWTLKYTQLSSSAIWGIQVQWKWETEQKRGGNWRTIEQVTEVPLAFIWNPCQQTCEQSYSYCFVALLNLAIPSPV